MWPNVIHLPRVEERALCGARPPAAARPSCGRDRSAGRVREGKTHFDPMATATAVPEAHHPPVKPYVLNEQPSLSGKVKYRNA